MGFLFSKKQQEPESKVTEQDKAVLSLKQQRDRLKKYQKQIVGKLEADREAAKKLLKDGKRDRAKLLLKKKRYLEGLLEKTDSQMDNLEQMVQTIEFAQIEVKVAEGLKQGNESLNALHKFMSLEDVERIMDETQEAVRYQQEIDDLLSGGLTQEDEEDVQRELEQLLGTTTELPNVPQDEPAALAGDLGLPDVPATDPGMKEKAKDKPAEMVAA